MAVPKKKTSPSRQGMRWSHKKASVDCMTSCKECGQWRRPHHMCGHCGHYNGRHVVVTRVQQRKIAAAQAEEE